MPSSDQPILEVKDFEVEFHTDSGVVQAVNRVSFDLYPGETLGIVGESGSGKSVTNLTMLGLTPQPPGKVVGGSVKYDGQELLSLSQKQWQNVRGKKIAMIFQDPMTALNPFLTVEEQLVEVTMLHMGLSRAEASKHAIELLQKVGIPGAEKRIGDYPHQFSGVGNVKLPRLTETSSPLTVIVNEPEGITSCQNLNGNSTPVGTFLISNVPSSPLTAYSELSRTIT